ncbi:MAG: HAMP domain-containing histidine kinase [Roseburia sp.]|nr:HAMP domain-containing histidine kinase [Roseburia sp.]
MNNKIKGSYLAKTFAWIGITLSGVIFAGSIFGAYLLWQSDIYNMTEEEAWEQTAEAVSYKYAVMALADMDEPANDKFLDTHFRYGVIEGESLRGRDLNSDSTYVERNFTDRVTEDDLYLKRYYIGEATKFRYTPSKGIFGEYWMVTDPDSYTYSTECYGIYYNEGNGIFYYETSDAIYPVQYVEIDLLTENEQQWYRYALQYYFDMEMYQMLGVTGISYSADTTSANDQTVTSTEVPITDYGMGVSNLTEETEPSVGARISDETMAMVETADGMVFDSGEIDLEEFSPEVAAILMQEYITFDTLEYAGATWRLAAADDGIFSGEVQRVAPGYLEGKEITTETDYYLQTDRILKIHHTESAETKAYMVVCQLPELSEVTGKFSDGDLFVQAHTLVSLLLHLRYSIYLIMFVALALFLFCFVFLVAAAGHRKGRTEIVESGLDLLPLEICLGAVLFLEIMMVWILDECSYRLQDMPFIVLFGFGLLCMFWLALATVLSVAVRIKCRRFWKNTVVYRMISLLGRLLRSLAESLPMLWKAIGLMVIIFGVEFINVIFMIDRRSGSSFLFWFVGKSALLFLAGMCIRQMWQLQKGGQRIAEGDLSHQVDTGKLHGEFRKHGEHLNSISSGMSRAVDERLKSERFKTELITNVSHDIKTPLTSIINYVDLLEKEELQNEKASEYLEVLDRQSNRLKKLIEDLMEASKASTGNLAVNLERLEAGVFLVQTVGEYEEKTREKDLELLIRKPEEPVYIMADGRHFWRVIDNLMNNICKYAQPGTRVYINIELRGEKVYLVFRNTSKYPLNITSEELMERFVRGDASRNTEGNGLGLSIARSLMELMGGSFALYVDGDLFKVELGFEKI